MKKEQTQAPVKLDKFVFFGAFTALLAVALPIILNPDGSAEVINGINTFILTKLGSFYIWFGLVQFRRFNTGKPRSYGVGYL